jgi:hypothetical protein
MVFDRALVFRPSEFCRQLVGGGTQDGFVRTNQPKLGEKRTQRVANANEKQQSPIVEPRLTDLYLEGFGYSLQAIWSRGSLDDPLTLQALA